MCFILSGCGTDMDKSLQDYACKNHGGVYSYWSFVYKCTCNDNTRISVDEWQSLKLPPDYYPKKNKNDR